MFSLHNLGTPELVRVIGGLVALVFYGVAGVVVLWCNRQLLRSIAHSFLGEMTARARGQKQLDEIEQRISERCGERKIARARMFSVSCIFLGIIYQAFTKQGVLRGEATMSLIQAAFYEVFIFTFALLGLFPAILTARTINFIYFWSVFLLIGVSVGGQEKVLAAYEIPLFVAAAAMCLFNLTLWLNALGLVLIGVTTAVMRPSQVGQVFLVLLGEFLGLAWLDHQLTTGVRLEIVGQKSKVELTAVKTLLGTICDAMVELDSNLCLMQHSQALANILLHGSGRSLQGSAMQDFMPDERDRRVFEERVGGADRASEVFHATICDSSATRLEMEFFSVAFVGPDARRRHLLGMREFTDIPPLTPSPERQRRAQPRPTPPSLPRARNAGDPAKSSDRGTPATLGRHSISDPTRPPDARSDTCSEASSSSSSSLSAAAPAAEAQGPRPRKETVMVAKKSTLVEALMQWQLSVPEGCCCPFHAAVQNAGEVAREMTSSPCRPEFGPSAEEWQCPACGIVSDDFKEKKRPGVCGCMLCRIVGFEGAERPRSSSSGREGGSGGVRSFAAL